MPIWVADYVLISYGTGSIMAVPAHDTRDLEFAEKFNIDVVQVVDPRAGRRLEGLRRRRHRRQFAAGRRPLRRQCDINGLPTPEAKGKITRWLEETDLGEGTIQYKLRDWLFSRQRYWGEPFPIMYGDDGVRARRQRERICRSRCPRWKTSGRTPAMTQRRAADAAHARDCGLGLVRA